MKETKPSSQILMLVAYAIRKRLVLSTEKRKSRVKQIKGEKMKHLNPDMVLVAPHRQSRFKTEETAQCQQHRHRWFNGWGTCTSQTRFWSNTPASAVGGRPAVLLGGGGGRLSVRGELTSGGAH